MGVGMGQASMTVNCHAGNEREEQLTCAKSSMIGVLQVTGLVLLFSSRLA